MEEEELELSRDRSQWSKPNGDWVLVERGSHEEVDGTTSPSIMLTMMRAADGVSITLMLSAPEAAFLGAAMSRAVG